MHSQAPHNHRRTIGACPHLSSTRSDCPSSGGGGAMATLARAPLLRSSRVRGRGARAPALSARRHACPRAVGGGRSGRLQTLAVQSEPSTGEGLAEKKRGQQTTSEEQLKASKARDAPNTFEEVGFDAVSVEDISGKDLGSPVAKYDLEPTHSQTDTAPLRRRTLA